MQNALIVDEFVTRTADMIEDFVPPSLNQRRANPRSKIVKHLVPGHSLPFALAALSGALERIKNTLGVIDLVESRRTFSTVASAAAGMCRIALEFADAAGLLIDICEQSAGGLAVETDCWNQAVMLAYLARPLRRVIFGPIVPAFRRRKTSETSRQWLKPGHRWIQRLWFIDHCLCNLLCACFRVMDGAS